MLLNKYVCQHCVTSQTGKHTSLFHYDFDDFYMTGAAEDLSTWSTNLLYDKYRAVAKRCAEFLLSHQFVESPADAVDGIYRCIVGSGQGLQCSAAVADAAFLTQNEIGGIRLLGREVKQHLGIIFYVRYRDNLLFILENQTCRHALKQSLDRMKHFKGKVEEESDSNIAFLDMRICKEVKGDRAIIYTKAVIRENGTLLAPTSAHPFSLHCRWPISFVLRLRNRCSRQMDFEESRETFLQKLRTNRFPTELIN